MWFALGISNQGIKELEKGYDDRQSYRRVQLGETYMGWSRKSSNSSSSSGCQYLVPVVDKEFENLGPAHHHGGVGQEHPGALEAFEINHDDDDD